MKTKTIEIMVCECGWKGSMSECRIKTYQPPFGDDLLCPECGDFVDSETIEVDEKKQAKKVD